MEKSEKEERWKEIFSRFSAKHGKGIIERAKVRLALKDEGIEESEMNDAIDYFFRERMLRFVRYTDFYEILKSGENRKSYTKILLPEEIKKICEMKKAKFETYDEALKWIDRKAKEYGGRNRFYTSDEYKQRYNEIQELYRESLGIYRQEATEAMDSVGAKVGQRVRYDIVGSWGHVEVQEGVIVLDNKGIPEVKLDSGKKVRWHKGFKPI